MAITKLNIYVATKLLTDCQNTNIRLCYLLYRDGQYLLLCDIRVSDIAKFQYVQYISNVTCPTWLGYTEMLTATIATRGNVILNIYYNKRNPYSIIQ